MRTRMHACTLALFPRAHPHQLAVAHTLTSIHTWASSKSHAQTHGRSRAATTGTASRTRHHAARTSQSRPLGRASFLKANRRRGACRRGLDVACCTLSVCMLHAAWHVQTIIVIALIKGGAGLSWSAIIVCGESKYFLLLLAGEPRPSPPPSLAHTRARARIHTPTRTHTSCPSPAVTSFRCRPALLPPSPPLPPLPPCCSFPPLLPRLPLPSPLHPLLPLPLPLPTYPRVPNGSAQARIMEC
jgi:hypothetical protein